MPSSLGDEIVDVESPKMRLSLKRASSVNTICCSLLKHEAFLNGIDDMSFNIFNVSQHMGREMTMPLVTWKIVDNLKIMEIVNQEKFACFLDKIFHGYKREVKYHNDLHGADVA
jgi:hypothetical protein